jgi:hypothetical protein
MRYVGRHRAPRPLLLRRPVVGGVAAAALLTVPVLYATGSFSGGIQGGPSSKQIADGTTRSSSSEAPLDEEPLTQGPTVIPTDDATGATSGDQAPGPGVITTPTKGSGGGAGTGPGTGPGTGGGGGPKTTTTTQKPAAGTKKPTTTTKKPSTTTKKPTATKTTTTKPPTTTNPPVETTEDPPPVLPTVDL